MQVEIDSKVADALYATGSITTSFGGFVEWGRNFVQELPSFRVTWVTPNVNLLAHVIARVAHSFEIPHC